MRFFVEKTKDNSFRFTTIQITKDYQVNDHIDKKNLPPALHLALGSFTGGELVTEVPEFEFGKLMGPQFESPGNKIVSECNGKMTLVNVGWTHNCREFKLVPYPDGRPGHRYAVVMFSNYLVGHVPQSDPACVLATWNMFPLWGCHGVLFHHHHSLNTYTYEKFPRAQSCSQPFVCAPLPTHLPIPYTPG